MSSFTLRSNDSEIPILLERLEEISQSLLKPPTKRSSFRADPESMLEDYMADIGDARKKTHETIKLAFKFHKSYQKANSLNQDINERYERLQERIEEMESEIQDQQSELASKEQRCESLTNDLTDIERTFKSMVSENNQLKRENNNLKKEIVQKEHQYQNKNTNVAVKSVKIEKDKDKVLQNEIANLNIEIKRQVEENEDLHYKLKEIGNLLQIEKSTSERLRNLNAQLKTENSENIKEIEDLKIEKSELDEKIIHLKNELIQQKGYNEQLGREYDMRRRRDTFTTETESGKEIEKVAKQIAEEKSDKENSESESESHTSRKSSFQLEEEEYVKSFERKDTKPKTVPAPMMETLGDYMFEEEEQESPQKDSKFFFMSTPKSNFNNPSPQDKIFFLSSPKSNLGTSYPALHTYDKDENQVVKCEDINIIGRNKSQLSMSIIQNILLDPMEKPRKTISNCNYIEIIPSYKPELKICKSTSVEIMKKAKKSLEINKITNDVQIFSKIKPKLADSEKSSIFIKPKDKESLVFNELYTIKIHRKTNLNVFHNEILEIKEIKPVQILNSLYTMSFLGRSLNFSVESQCSNSISPIKAAEEKEIDEKLLKRSNTYLFSDKQPGITVFPHKKFNLNIMANNSLLIAKKAKPILSFGSISHQTIHKSSQSLQYENTPKLSIINPRSIDIEKSYNFEFNAIKRPYPVLKTELLFKNEIKPSYIASKPKCSINSIEKICIKNSQKNKPKLNLA